MVDAFDLVGPPAQYGIAEQPDGTDGQGRRLGLDWLTPSARQNSLITDICVLYARLIGAWLPSSAYVRLLGDLGVPPATARTGLHRMAKGGFLDRAPRDDAAGYAMSIDWLEFIGDVDEQYAALLRGRPPALAEGWTLVSFSIPESRRADRHVLRSVLDRWGFGTVAAGLWIVPGNRALEVNRLLGHLGFSGYASVFTAEHHGPGDPAAFVASCWDLPAIRAAYEQVIDAHLPALRRAERRRRIDPRGAFVDLTLAHNHWRLHLERDPGLPAEVLPDDWPGFATRRLIRELFVRLHGPALDYVRALSVTPR